MSDSLPSISFDPEAFDTAEALFDRLRGFNVTVVLGSGARYDAMIEGVSTSDEGHQQLRVQPIDNDGDPRGDRVVLPLYGETLQQVIVL